ncbi:formate dehydrogenase [Variovorax sp. PCZ-1]|uniref:formate dehydrogenase n=1 Tax=Variovorax sp. PCZ-1 TaxID=2835533 RepID=UPI001BD02DA4|nr:formate dehydrogenase [Variovorax sp. PCZ-1]MBS7807587.1 formate dehydrogenase [Variovorax sp. PCZ-1]
MDQEVKTPSRRGMLFGAAIAGTAAAAVVALPKVAPQEAAQETLKPAPEKGGGYSLTAHVKQYYSTTLI